MGERGTNQPKLHIYIYIDNSRIIRNSHLTYIMSSQNIQIRRVSITDPKDMPKHGIAETPGGTLFGTTPGGTRIIYDRLFLLQRKESPAARTPPKLPQITGVTADLSGDGPQLTGHNRKVSIIQEDSRENDAEQQQPSNNTT